MSHRHERQSTTKSYLFVLGSVEAHGGRGGGGHLVVELLAGWQFCNEFISAKAALIL